MEPLPELTKLTETEKDQLIIAQAKLIQRLEQKIKQLEERVSKNSSNSSKPPSSDGFNKPDPKSRRHKNKQKKKVGGQKGHPGSTLKRTEHPTVITHHDPVCCGLCSHSLLNATRLGYESRQVYDLPSLNFEVTDHRAYKKCCLHCGAVSESADAVCAVQ